MEPNLVIVTSWALINGRNAGGGTPSPPSASPLKVWNGSEWVSTGVSVKP